MHSGGEEGEGERRTVNHDRAASSASDRCQRFANCSTIFYAQHCRRALISLLRNFVLSVHSRSDFTQREGSKGRKNNNVRNTVAACSGIYARMPHILMKIYAASIAERIKQCIARSVALNRILSLQKHCTSRSRNFFFLDKYIALRRISIRVRHHE